MSKRLLLSIVVAVFMPCAAFAGKVSISSGEYAPYTGKDLPHGGFVNHVISEAFRESGYEVVIAYYPWARAFELARVGAADAVSYVYMTERRGRDYLFSDPITHERLVVFSKKETKIPEWKSFADFKGFRIGITRDFSYTDEFWRLADKGVLTYDVTNSDYSNFAMLIAKRIDIFFADELVGFTILRERFAPGVADTVKSSERAIADHTGTLGFTRKTKRGARLRDIFNNGLEQMKESGKFQEMYNALLAGEYNR